MAAAPCAASAKPSDSGSSSGDHSSGLPLRAVADLTFLTSDAEPDVIMRWCVTGAAFTRLSLPVHRSAGTSVSTDPVSSVRHRLSRLPGEASPSASDQTPPVEAVDSDVSAAGAGLTPACEGPGGVPVLHRRCVTCITCNVDALDKARVVTVEENRRRGAARQRSAVVTPQLAHANPTAAEAISITVAYSSVQSCSPAGGSRRRGRSVGAGRGTYSKHADSTHRRPIDLDRTQDLRAEGRMRRATVDRSTGSGPGQRRDSAGSSRYCLRCVPRQVDILAAACGDARA